MEGEFDLKVYHVVADVVNFFRAVTGVGGLGLPFAFRQAGWLLSICFLVFVTLWTIYASEVLIQCKYLAIKRIRKEPKEEKGKDKEEKCFENSSISISLDDDLCTRITMKEIGQTALGSTFGALFELCCLGSMFGIACNYHVLFGNTLYHFIYGDTDEQFDHNTTSVDNITESDIEQAVDKRSGLLILFVLCPLPLYIGTAFFREFRHFSLLSGFTALALILSVVLSTAYAFVGFEVSDAQPFVIETSVVGFLQILTAFEILPVILFLESSMRGNHHRFCLYVRTVIPFMILLMSVYGLVGYLRYGARVPQMFSSVFPMGLTSSVIDILLMTVALFAYAMPIQPCLDYVENVVFSTKTHQNPPGGVNEKPSELTSIKESAQGDVQPVPLWKGNTVRVVVVLIGALLAVFMKDLFAFLLAYIGAIGAAPVLFIFPASCLLKLKSDMSRTEWTVNVLSIIFGCLITVIGIVLTTIQTVNYGRSW